jgi:hypothetical protein
MIGNTLLNILKICVIMFNNILKYFFESFKAHGFTIVFVIQHFFQPSFEFTKCEMEV